MAESSSAPKRHTRVRIRRPVQRQQADDAQEVVETPRAAEVQTPPISQRDLANPRSLPPTKLTDLQRTIGNQAVAQLLTPAALSPAIPIQREISEEEYNQIITKERAPLSVEDLQGHTRTIEQGPLSKFLADTVAKNDEDAKQYQNEPAKKVETNVWEGFDKPQTDWLFLENIYSPHVWIMANNFRNAKLTSAFANQINQMQAEEADVDPPPDIVIRKNVVNKGTIAFAEDVTGESDAPRVRVEGEDLSKFFYDTDNGKHTRFILMQNNLKVDSVDVLWGESITPEIIIKVSPGEFNVGQLTKEQKELRTENRKQQKERLLEHLEEKEEQVKMIVNEKKKTRKPKKVKGKKKCYITTACVEYMGLADDCEELTVLREFRDTYLLRQPNGQSLVALYYDHAPAIVDAIHKRDDEEEILAALYGVIQECVAAIRAGKPERAFALYTDMVIRLKDEFVPDAALPNTLRELCLLDVVRSRYKAW